MPAKKSAKKSSSKSGAGEIELGASAPDFTLPDDAGNPVTLSKLRGKAVILYFYPRDDTPGCTAEACDFRDNLSKFARAGANVIGVSTDNQKSHDKFKKKYKLPFTLVSDEEHSLADAYGVWVEKNRYGRKYMGIERSTFLIDPKGKVARAWRKVKVEGHADEVLEAAKAL